jgi:hypothetical protein
METIEMVNAPSASRAPYARSGTTRAHGVLTGNAVRLSIQGGTSMIELRGKVGEALMAARV